MRSAQASSRSAGVHTHAGPHVTSPVRRLFSAQALPRLTAAGRLAFFGMVLSVVVVSPIVIFNALSWLDRPFAGFLVNPRMRVGTVGQSHWTGPAAGVRNPDIVLEVAGRRVNAFRDLDAVVAKTPVGTPVRYVIERGGARVEAEVPTMRFTASDLALTFWVTFLSGIALFAVGTIVFVLKPDTSASFAFLSACFVLSVYTIVSFDVFSSHWGFIRLYILADTFIPAAFLHLSLVFPERSRFVQRHRWLEVAPYVLSAALTLPYQVFYKMGPDLLVARITRLYAVVAAVGLIAAALARCFGRASPLGRQRAKVVLFGAALAFPLPAAARYSSLVGGSFLGITIPTNLLAVPIILFPASIAYAIARHNLFDVDVYIKRAVGWGVMTALVASSYVSLQAVVDRLVLGPMFGAGGQRVYPILFAVLVVFLFNPVSLRVRGLVDRVFFRARLDYKTTISAVSGALTSLLNLGEILRQVVSTLRAEMFVDSAGVVVRGRPGRPWTVFLGSDTTGTASSRPAATESAAENDPLVALLREKKALITKYDLEEDARYADVAASCLPRFTELEATLAIPLLYRDELVGALILGHKKSGQFYTREDIDLLSTMANQAAVAIENAYLFEENLEKGRMEEELKIAHDIQMGMLPDKAPELEGLKIVARTISAREVGGDFYDFVEVPPASGSVGRVGIIVGDVSGKGVSAGLLMAGARSTYRVLLDADPAVDEVMTLANQRLHRDIRKGMFVALLYAVLDPVARTLTLSNAGQTQPVLCQPGADPSYITTEGDTFPLGIVPDCDYREAKLSLSRGSVVVFYTDGAVEAMNAQAELYGFDRFLASVHEGRDLDGAALLDKLLDDIACFVGGTEQHDDITIIVARVG